MFNKKVTVIILAACIVYLLLGCSKSATVTIERSAELRIANELEKIARSLGVDQRKCIITGLDITAWGSNGRDINAFQLSFLVLHDNRRIDEYITSLGNDGKLTIRQNNKVLTNPDDFNLTMHDLITALGKLRLSDLFESSSIEGKDIVLQPGTVGESLVTVDKQTAAKIVDGKIIKAKLNERLVVTSPSSKLEAHDGHSARMFLIGNNATKAPL